ncbi:MAG: HNH endonuclease signature motif containing protein [Acidimicrobiales bacterium]
MVIEAESTSSGRAADNSEGSVVGGGAAASFGHESPPGSVDALVVAMMGWGAWVAARSADGGWSAESLAEAMVEWRRLQRCCDAVGLALADAADGLASAGSGPPADVALAAEGSVTEAAARVEAERARTVAGLPAVREAVAAGKVGAANLDVLSRTFDGLAADEAAALRQRDGDVADVMVRLGPDSFRRWLHRVRDRIRSDHGSGAAERARRDAFVRISPDRARRGYRVSGWLPAVDGAAARAALEAECRRLVRPDPDSGGIGGRGHALVLPDPDSELGGSPTCAEETASMVMAEAFGRLLIRGANTTPSFANQRVGVEITVLADQDTLDHGPHDHSVMETADGLALSAGELGRLCCDATLRRVEAGELDRLSVSRAARTATSAQRAALLALYGGCAISGASWSECEMHHVVFWESGGGTDIDNLVPVSRRWHHLIHDKGWRLDMDADRTLRIWRPDGQLHRTIPPPTALLQRRCSATPAPADEVPAEHGAAQRVAA